jgi:ABC-type siderophore export system fused ATPase/permease subunit
MITFTTFWCYTKLAHRELLVPEALSAMYAFQKVQQPLFDLPGRVLFYLRTRVSVRRLERFFAEEELEGDHLSPTESHEYRDELPESDKLSQSLAFYNSTHIYPQHEIRDEILEPFKLRCPDITFPEGKLTVVYGDNASGKSSLLMACLGGESYLKYSFV